jgi:hypothetical protein
MYNHHMMNRAVPTSATMQTEAVHAREGYGFSYNPLNDQMKW